MAAQRNLRKDPVSQLPHSVIHHILSFLPSREAAHTCTLSKAWNTAVSSYLVLDIDSKRYRMSTTYDQGKFVQFVDEILDRYKRAGHILKFRLVMNLKQGGEDLESYVDTWVQHVVLNMVEHLELDIELREGLPYRLPLISLEHLQHLKLSKCRLQQNFFPQGVQLPSLIELSLYEVEVQQSQLQLFILSCPELQILSIELCEQISGIEIHDLPKINTLLVNGVNQVQITAASLRRFFFIGQGKRCRIEAICDNVKELVLASVCITNEEFGELLSKFPFLYDLKIEFCTCLRNIHLSKPTLKQLSISFCKQLRVVDIDCPSLLTFGFGTYDVPSSISVSAKDSTLYFKIFPNFNIDTEWFSKLLKYLHNFRGRMVILTLRLSSTSVSFIWEDLARISTLKAFDLSQLKLSSASSELNDSVLLIEGILSVTHPRTLSIGIKPSNADFIKILYEMLVPFVMLMADEQNPATCCALCDEKCWRHFLKSVQVISITENHTERCSGDVDSFLESLKSCLTPGQEVHFVLAWSEE